MVIIIWGGEGRGRYYTFVGDQLVAESSGVEQTLRGPEGESDI